MTQVDIFISSKMQELSAEREALSELIPSLSDGIIKLHAWIFEKNAPASERSIREEYLEKLRSSALYIGLFWNAYGEWTIDEFDRASEWGIPRHIYVKDVDAHKRDPELEAFLLKHGDVEHGITAKWFKTVDELCDALKLSLMEWLDRTLRKHTVNTEANFINEAEDLHELPRKFVGRKSELERIRSYLDEGEQVLIQAHGGAGKTALAAEVVANWLDDHEKVLWIRLGNTDSDVIFEALTHPFGTHETVAKTIGDAKIKVVRQLLKQSGTSLVVLDDAWNGTILHAVLRAIPRNLPVLITARQRFGLSPMVELTDLPPHDAVKLLQLHGSNYAVGDNAPKLCEKLGYHAFAIEIAGKTLLSSQQNPGELLKQLDSPHELKVPLEFAETGRESVAVLLEQSLNILSKATRQLFIDWGAFFAPTITAEMLALYKKLEETKDNESDVVVSGIQTSTRDDKHEVDDIESALKTLVQHGLVQHISPTNRSIAYYRLHDLAYAYATAQNEVSDHKLAITACFNYTKRYETTSTDNFMALHAELANYVGAAQYSFDQEMWSETEGFAQTLCGFGERGGFLFYQGHYQLAITLLEQASFVAGKQNKKQQQGSYLVFIGVAYTYLGHYDKATKYLEQALDISHKLSDQEMQGSILNNLGNAYSGLGQYDKAIEYYEQALNLSREIDNKTGEANILGNLGSIYNKLEEFENAIKYLQQALTIACENGDKIGEGNALGNLGHTYTRLEQYKKATEHLEQALVILKEIGNKQGEGTNLANLGNTHIRMGQYDKAIEYYEQALNLFREIGSRAGEANALGNLGSIYNNLEEFQKAVEYLEQALNISREIGTRTGELETLANLGNTHIRMGQYDKAIEYYEQALNISCEIGDRAGEANALGNLGGIYDSLEEFQKVIYYYERALNIICEISDGNNAVEILGDLGNAYIRIEQYREATAYHERALNILQGTGNRQREGAILGSLGMSYSRMGQYDKAIEYHEQALNILREVGNKQGECMALRGIGSIHNSLEQYQKAIEYHEQALNISREIGDSHIEGNQLHDLGLAFENLGQYDKAIEYYEQALNILREIIDKKIEFSTFTSLGHIHNNLGQIEKAIEYYEQALMITQEVGDKQNEIGILRGLGFFHHKVEQIEKAIEYFEQALMITREVGDKQGEYGTLKTLGFFYHEIAQIEKAIEYFEQALNIAQKIGNRSDEVNLSHILGLDHLNLLQFLRAIEYLEEGLKVAREVGYHLGEANCVTGLGDVYLQQGEHKKAQETYEMAIKFYDFLDEHQEAVRVLGVLAQLFADMSDEAGAIRSLKEYIRRSEELGDLDQTAGRYFRAGYIYDSLKHYHEAIEMYGKAIELQPNNAMIYRNISIAYMKLLQLDMAQKALEQAEQLESEHPYLSLRRAELHVLRGDGDKALKEADHVFDHQDTPKGRAWVARSMASLLLQRMQEAYEAAQNAVQETDDPKDFEEYIENIEHFHKAQPVITGVKELIQIFKSAQ